MTLEKLKDFIKKHGQECIRYNKLWDMYIANHDILKAKKKEGYKPDNRLVANYASYLVNTLNGYFIGIPIKTTVDDKGQAEYLEFIQNYNNQDDNNAELSKYTSIFGHAYELLFLDEDAQVGIVNVKPTEAFLIYDDSIRKRPLYAVRYTETDDVIKGSYSDSNAIYYFQTNDKGEIFISGEEPHYFKGVPLIEYVENEEKQAVFEQVITLINAHNKALSEKANDVDYFADAYLKVLGAVLSEDQLDTLRDSRIINISGENSENLVVDFLRKPDADESQENLLNRLDRLIFQISMIANINDEHFGNNSGVAMAYKLQSMSNLANAKERKFTAGMNKRYKLISNLPNSKLGEYDWMKIKYRFTRNTPKNLLEEVQTAQGMTGVVSKKTQLSVISAVDNVDEEIEALKAEDILTSGIPEGTDHDD